MKPKRPHDLVAGFLTQEAAVDEWAIACPTCGFEYSHMRDMRFVGPPLPKEGDEDVVWWITILFHGECGHVWELHIQQQKGVNFVRVETRPDPPFYGEGYGEDDGEGYGEDDGEDEKRWPK